MHKYSININSNLWLFLRCSDVSFCSVVSSLWDWCPASGSHTCCTCSQLSPRPPVWCICSEWTPRGWRWSWFSSCWWWVAMACLRAGSWSLTSRSAGRLFGLGLVVLVDGLAGGFRVPHPDGGWLGGSDSGTELRMSESWICKEFILNRSQCFYSHTFTQWMKQYVQKEGFWKNNGF